MSHDKITALIALVREHVGTTRMEEVAEFYPAVEAVCAALEASVQAPAVSREALARHFHRDAWTLSDEEWIDEYVADNREHHKRMSLLQADALIASGVLQDAAEVRADAIEEIAEAFHWASPATRMIAEEWMRARARQVREGK